MSNTSTLLIPLFAGTRPDGERVVEELRVSQVEASAISENQHTGVSGADGRQVDERQNGVAFRYRLTRSPSFVQGLAAGDEIDYDASDNSFTLVRHSGNICVRVFAQHQIHALADNVIAEWTKLGGEKDFMNDRMLVLSAHVSCGFKEMESILNRFIGERTQSVWYYGNVYDPVDGVTPLNWWHDFARQD